MSTFPLPITACLIVRDEKDNLATTLPSLSGRVAEIVVVDTGSRDGSPNVARAAGARVFSQAWTNDFSAARNRAIQEATAPHCLHIDADETVDAETWAGLVEHLAAGGGRGLVTVVSKTIDGIARDNITRVCPNDGQHHFVGRIHEQLQGPSSIRPTGLVLHHTGYQPEVIEKRGKLDRNITLLQQALDQAPHDPYLLYQLGRTLWRRDKSEQAIELLVQSLQHCGDQDGFTEAVVRDLGYALKERGESATALPLVSAYTSRFPQATDLHFLIGILCIDEGNLPGVERAFNLCLELGERQDGGSTIEGVGSYRAHHNLGLLYELRGNKAIARKHYKAALATRPDFAPAQERLRMLG